MEKYNCFNKKSFDACFLVLMVEIQMVNLIPIILLAIILSSKFQMEKYNCFNKKSFDACFLVLMVEIQMVNLIPIILLAIILSSKFQMEKIQSQF
jgi:hypothetical protein